MAAWLRAEDLLDVSSIRTAPFPASERHEHASTPRGRANRIGLRAGIAVALSLVAVVFIRLRSTTRSP